MFCKTCQTHLPQDALSCPTCGTPVTEEERLQATNSDTILRPTDMHYESDLPADEKDISSIIAVHHTHTTPMVADVYHEEEALSSTEIQHEHTLPYTEAHVFSNEETNHDHEATATELQTVQNVPLDEDADHDHEAATELQVVPSDEDNNHEAMVTELQHVPSNEDTDHELAATKIQHGPSNEDVEHEVAAEELHTVQDISPFHGEQPFSEYAFVQEPLPVAMPVTQTDIPVPQIAQAKATPAYPPPAYTYQVPTPHKQRQTNVVLLVLALIGLGLVLLMENGGVIFFAAAYQPAQVHAQATAQAHKLATAQAKATSISQLQATAQAQDDAENLKLSLAQAQTGDPGALYTMATSGKPTLDASSPTTSNSTCVKFNGGMFHVLESEKNSFSSCRSTFGSDFVFQTQMNIHTGDAGGLLFRSGGNDNIGYFLRFDQNGYYDIFLENDNSRWLQGSFIAGFKTGHDQTNLITIIALGDNFYLYSNKQFIGQIKDNTYSSGLIKLIAVDIQATSTDVFYSSAEFWDLP